MSWSILPERVLMTADTIGGVWTYAVELSRVLGRHGIEVALATMGAPLNDYQWAEVEKIPSVSIYESEYKLEWMQDPWDDTLKAGDWLLQLERDFKPDLVHLNGYAHGYLPWQAPVLVVGHSCVLSWWQAVKGEEAPDSWNRYRFEVSRGLGSAGMVAAPTSAMLSCLHRHYGLSNSCRVIPNGRDSSLFHPSAKEPFILAAGRIWDEAKNIQALGKIAGHINWPIYLAGDERHPDGGSANCGPLCWLGRLSQGELSEWYARASIYALPARYEPFGLTALEAALSGCALVLGDIPSLREIWQDGAVFVPPDDVDALQRAVELLIANKSHRIEIGDRARTIALEYDIDRMASGYLESYEYLIKRGCWNTASEEKQ